MASTKNITEKEVQLLIQGKLSRYFGVSSAEATKEQIYKAVVMSVRDILLEKRHWSFFLITVKTIPKMKAGEVNLTRL